MHYLRLTGLFGEEELKQRQRISRISLCCTLVMLLSSSLTMASIF